MAYTADSKPGELTALTTLATDDVFVVGDTSDVSEVAKGITKANLITDLGSSFAPVLGADDNYVTDAEKAIVAATTASYTTAEASKLAGIEALADVTDATNVSAAGAQMTSGKDATGGYAGLTLFKINFKNAANTFTNFLTNATTAARTWTFPDKDGTVAMTSDITGTNSGTNTGDQTISLTGDVTGSGTGSFAATIAANAVTNAKAAQMATKTYKGRTSAGTGNAEDVAVATLKADLSLDNVDNTSNATERAATATLTNKRVTKRTGTTTSSATPTINTDNVDEYYITAQTEAITSFTTNLSGTPTLGQTLFISIIGTAARAVTFGASFANGPVALPTTTVTTTQLSVLFKWDGSIWRCYASGSTV